MDAIEEIAGANGVKPAGIAICVEDDALRERVAKVAARVCGPVVALEADVETLIADCEGGPPACAILAGRRPDAEIGRAASRIHSELAGTPILVVCLRAGSGDVRRAIGYGIDGVVLERRIEAVLAPAVAAVRSGQTCVPSGNRSEIETKVLTRREKQMLALVARGLTNAEIAASLYLAESTVKSHLSSAFGKINVSSRYEAASLILDPERGRGLSIPLTTEQLRAMASADEPDARSAAAAEAMDAAAR